LLHFHLLSVWEHSYLSSDRTMVQFYISAARKSAAHTEVECGTGQCIAWLTGLSSTAFNCLRQYCGLMQMIVPHLEQCEGRVLPAVCGLSAGLSALLSVWLSDVVRHWAASWVDHSVLHTASSPFKVAAGYYECDRYQRPIGLCACLPVLLCLNITSSNRWRLTWFDWRFKRLLFASSSLKQCRAAKGMDVRAPCLTVLPAGVPQRGADCTLILLYRYDFWKYIGRVFERRLCPFIINQLCHWKGPFHS